MNELERESFEAVSALQAAESELAQLQIRLVEQSAIAASMDDLTSGALMQKWSQAETAAEAYEIEIEAEIDKIGTETETETEVYAYADGTNWSAEFSLPDGDMSLGSDETFVYSSTFTEKAETQTKKIVTSTAVTEQSSGRRGFPFSLLGFGNEPATATAAVEQVDSDDSTAFSEENTSIGVERQLWTQMDTSAVVSTVPDGDVRVPVDLTVDYAEGGINLLLRSCNRPSLGYK